MFLSCSTTTGKKGDFATTENDADEKAEKEYKELEAKFLQEIGIQAN